MKPQIIEQTSKKYKLLSRVGGWALLITTGFVVFNDKPDAITASLMVIALIAFLWGRIGKWWHHE